MVIVPNRQSAFVPQTKAFENPNPKLDYLIGTKPKFGVLFCPDQILYNSRFSNIALRE
jgi:hypothetical protein